MKEEYLNDMLKWQKANQRILCYYNQATDKSVFSKSMIDSYLKYENKLEDIAKQMKVELESIEQFGLSSLNRVLNDRILWTYEFYDAYYKDLVSIKRKLKDSELLNAVKYCERNF